MSEKPDKHLDLVVVVSGEPVTVEINGKQTVAQLIHKALQHSGNQGQDPDQWELRTQSGELLDPASHLGSVGIHEGTTLFLNPRAAAGGC